MPDDGADPVLRGPLDAHRRSDLLHLARARAGGAHLRGGRDDRPAGAPGAFDHAVGKELPTLSLGILGVSVPTHVVSLRSR